jgi:membrane protease YdiL (CAAX protease family)
MTAVLRRTDGAVAAAAAGCALLALRPQLVAHIPAGDGLPALGFAGLLLVGWRCPVPDGGARSARRSMVAPLALGLLAFTAGRVLAGGHSPWPLSGRVVLLNGLAAVAEEAFFRRLVYGALLPGGAAVAAGGSALLFAVVHVPLYGLWVLPLDLAAGLVLAWQRHATGSWVTPALTHAVANLLVVI